MASDKSILALYLKIRKRKPVNLLFIDRSVTV
jgi:hypothetical protein